MQKSADRIDLVKYAAGSGDFNPVHYDPDFPQARAIGDNIVHGRLKYAALGELVSNWLSHRGWIVALRCEFRRMDIAGTPYTCRGRVTGKDLERRELELEVWVEDAAGHRTTVGTVIARLFEHAESR